MEFSAAQIQQYTQHRALWVLGSEFHWLYYCREILGPCYDLIDRLTEGGRVEATDLLVAELLGLDLGETGTAHVIADARWSLQNHYQTMWRAVPPVLAVALSPNSLVKRKLIAQFRTVQPGSVQEYLLTEAATFLSVRCSDLTELNQAAVLPLANVVLDALN